MFQDPNNILQLESQVVHEQFQTGGEADRVLGKLLERKLNLKCGVQYIFFKQHQQNSESGGVSVVEDHL